MIELATLCVVDVVVAQPAETAQSAAMDEQQFVRDIEHAKQLTADGRAAEAIEYWLARSDKYGGRGGHYENELGNFYLNSSQFEQAKQAYLRGVALGKPYPRLYVGLSLTHLALSEFSDAQAWATRATEEFPRWWLGYYTQGQIEWKRDHYAAAKTWLEKSISLQAEPVAFWLYGIVAYETRDWEQCVDALKLAIEKDSSYAQELINVKALSISLAHLGIFSEAEHVLGQYDASAAELEEVRAIRAVIQSIKADSNTRR